MNVNLWIPCHDYIQKQIAKAYFSGLFTWVWITSAHRTSWYSYTADVACQNRIHRCNLNLPDNPPNKVCGVSHLIGPVKEFHIALFRNSQTYSANLSGKDFDWMLLGIPCHYIGHFLNVISMLYCHNIIRNDGQFKLIPDCFFYIVYSWSLKTASVIE